MSNQSFIAYPSRREQTAAIACNRFHSFDHHKKCQWVFKHFQLLRVQQQHYVCHHQTPKAPNLYPIQQPRSSKNALRYNVPHFVFITCIFVSSFCLCFSFCFCFYAADVFCIMERLLLFVLPFTHSHVSPHYYISFGLLRQEYIMKCANVNENNAPSTVSQPPRHPSPFVICTPSPSTTPHQRPPTIIERRAFIIKYWSPPSPQHLPSPPGPNLYSIVFYVP